MPIFSKCLKKYTCARYLDGVCRDSWVLASNPRDVKETCDSLFSVTKFLHFLSESLIIKCKETKSMAAKKHTFDIGTLSSAIDKITMQGSKVFINFSGNEKTYEFEWKPANKKLLTALDGFVKNPESFSLGRFYNDSLKNGDLLAITV